MSFSIFLKDVSCGFSGTLCFENFTTHTPLGTHVAVIGRNGSGKSTLLKLLSSQIQPLTGQIDAPDAMVVQYVPQYTLELNKDLVVSGGEGAYKRLARAFQSQPDLLLLDEPTTHLDRTHRQGLLRMIQRFSGILIVATHDVELLEHFHCVWSIENKKVICFQGTYHDYMEQRRQNLEELEHTLHLLKCQQDKNHESLMREQQRAKKSRLQGKQSIEKKKWPTVRSPAKVDRAVTTSQDKKAQLRQQRIEIQEKQDQLTAPEILRPTFSLRVNALEKGPILAVHQGTIGYTHISPILEDIYLQLSVGQRLALVGNNGSGKSTLLKALLKDPKVHCSGQWELPLRQHIGYIDQHQSMLKNDQTVYEEIKEAMPEHSNDAIRTHLSHFLFRSQVQVHAQVHQLSSGERTRLCLAKLSANTPSLLLLDEVTNYLDLETREQVIHVLKDYPGALIVVSHDASFLHAIGCQEQLICTKGRVSKG